MSERVPEGWVAKKLKDVSVLTKGLTYASSDYSDEQNGLPFLTLKSISKDGGYSPVGLKFYKGEYREHHALNIGDVLFANTDLTRNGDVVGSPLFFDGFGFDGTTLYSMDLSKLKVDLERTDSKFLYYLLMTHRVKRYMVNSSAGSTVLHLDTNRVKELNLNLPPLPEQKKIASILTSVDEVIETTQKQIDKLQDLKKATMNELLTKGIGHTEFKDSELGRIPKSWEVVELSSRCKRVCVGFVGTCEPFYRSDGIPLIRTGNLRDGILDLSNAKFVTREFHEKEKKSQLNVGDLLIARHGDFGQTCIVPKELKEANCLNIVIIKPDFNFFYPMFLKYIFNSDNMKDMFEAKAEGSTQKVISTTEIAKTRVVMPPLSEQKEIINHLWSIDKVLNQKKLKLSQTQNLKKSLMQDLLTGKVRVQVN